jgi:hypothetical protein
MRLNMTRLVDPQAGIGATQRRVQNVSAQAATAGTGPIARPATTRLKPMSEDPLTRVFERLARALMGLR